MVSRLEKRVRLAYLDAAIITCIVDYFAMDSQSLVKTLRKHFLNRLSAGTIYPVIYRLEREGYIQKVRVERKFEYALTRKGKIAFKEIEEHKTVFQEIFKLDKNMAVC